MRVSYREGFGSVAGEGAVGDPDQPMRCYVESGAWSERTITLSAEESHHALHVLRAQIGECIELFDGAGRRATAEVTGIGRDRVTAAVREQSAVGPPPCALILVQALVREARLDWIIQKATELGVARIVPVRTEHAVVRLRDRKAEARLKRWRRIAIAAAKQSGVLWLPEIDPPDALEAGLRRVAPLDVLLVGALTEDARPLRDVMAESRSHRPRRAGVAIGPEGGFTAGEQAVLRAAGGQPVRLGGSILRAETAALYTLCVLRYEFGNGGRDGRRPCAR